VKTLSWSLSSTGNLLFFIQLLLYVCVCTFVTFIDGESGEDYLVCYLVIIQLGRKDFLEVALQLGILSQHSSLPLSSEYSSIFIFNSLCILWYIN
jgi:hypothetical protein